MARTTRTRGIWFLSLLCFAGVLAKLVAGTQGAPEEHRLTQLRLKNTPLTYAELGVFVLEPPLRLPGRKDERLSTQVWVRVPEGAFIEVNPEDGRLRFPSGTLAARVESLAPKKGADATIVDIRATRIESKEQRFQVYRPESPQPFSELHGVEWVRGAPYQEKAASQFINQAARRATQQPLAESAARKAVLNNDCSSCHEISRATARRVHEYGAVHRRTDADGFFVPQSLFDEQVPLEDYAPRELNEGDKMVEIRCFDEMGTGVEARFLQGLLRCEDGSVPLGRLLVRAALLAGDQRAKRVCESRRYLFSHMSPAAQEFYAERIEECGELELASEVLLKE